MAVIREQYVYQDTDQGVQKEKMHPVTEVGAIIDMGDALDAYREAFVDPLIESLTDKVLAIANFNEIRFLTDQDINDIVDEVLSI